MVLGVRHRRTVHLQGEQAPAPAAEPVPAAQPAPASQPILRSPARAHDARRVFAADPAASLQAYRLNAQLDAGSMRLPQAARVVGDNFDRFRGDDQLITRQDLERVRDSSDPAVTREMKDAARFLLASPASFAALDTGAREGDVDGKISRQDVEGLRQRLGDDDWSAPTAGVQGEVDTRTEMQAVLERYLPLADTAAGKGGADGQVSDEDVDALLADAGTPEELRQAAAYMDRYGIDTKEEGGGFWDTITGPVREVRDFFDHPQLSEERRRELEDAAATARDRDQGQPELPLNEQHNAHKTNTADELQAALEGDYQWLEGDIHREGIVDVPGVDQGAIMGHDPQDDSGLGLREWLEIGGASGRGLKLDIKQGAAVDTVIEEVRRAGIPQDRLIFNADVMDGPGARGGVVRDGYDALTDSPVSVGDLQRIREAFPEARISIGTHTGGGAEPPRYTEAQVDEMIRVAQEVGGPVMFPLRAEYVTPEVVRRLEAYGEVSIWNDPSTLALTPEQVQQEEAKYRSWGVTGLIDLRPSGD